MKYSHCRVSHRPLLLCKLKGDCILAAGSDHLLHLVNSRDDTYSKLDLGHRDWVTACCFGPTDSIISGGMDSQLFYHCKSKTYSLRGPTSSITKIFSKDNAIYASSYDGYLYLYNKTSFRLKYNSQSPITDFLVYSSNQIITATKHGDINVFDANTNSSTPKTSIKAHKNRIIGLFGDSKLHNESLIFSAGDDFNICMFDTRLDTSRCVSRTFVQGATNLEMIDSANFIVSSNKMLSLFDLRKAGNVRYETNPTKVLVIPDGGKCSSYCYSLTSFTNFNNLGMAVVSGWGDGKLRLDFINNPSDSLNLKVKTLNHDVLKSCFSDLENAIRSIQITEKSISAVGDDGIVSRWIF